PRAVFQAAVYDRIGLAAKDRRPGINKSGVSLSGRNAVSPAGRPSRRHFAHIRFLRAGKRERRRLCPGCTGRRNACASSSVFVLRADSYSPSSKLNQKEPRILLMRRIVTDPYRSVASVKSVVPSAHCFVITSSRFRIILAVAEYAASSTVSRFASFRFSPIDN